MEPILDHITLNVSNYELSKEFYAKALAPLGILLVMDVGTSVGFGKGKPELWLRGSAGSYQKSAHIELITPIHLALRANNREEVDAFWKAAIAAGGTDFGAPGVRELYHPGYYGAFILDPDGHNLEAVCHGRLLPK